MEIHILLYRTECWDSLERNGTHPHPPHHPMDLCSRDYHEECGGSLTKQWPRRHHREHIIHCIGINHMSNEGQMATVPRITIVLAHTGMSFDVQSAHIPQNWHFPCPSLKIRVMVMSLVGQPNWKIHIINSTT